VLAIIALASLLFAMPLVEARRRARTRWTFLSTTALLIALLAGASLLRTLHHRIPVAPTRIGKYATFALAATVVLALAGEFGAYTRVQVAPFVAAMGLLAAECVSVSFAQYFLFFLRAARDRTGVDQPQARRR